MNIAEAQNLILENLLYKNISTINEDKNNKGNFGHTIEKLLNLKLGSHHLDFTDGDLKTGTLKNGQLKDDFKIAKSFDKEYLRQKMNMLVVLRDQDNNIVYSEHVNILDHPIYEKYFEKEIDRINEIGIDNISQSDTVIFVAKTNDTGKKEKSNRALYVSRAFMSHFLGFGFGNAIKGKSVIAEILQYESSRSK